MTWKEHVVEAEDLEQDKHFFSASISWRKASQLAPTPKIQAELRLKLDICNSKWKV